MADTLPCADGAGSINNPDNPTVITPPYVVVEPCVGAWEISNADDLCAITEAQNQAGYAAEIININGAPLRIYKLLGVHEQGNGPIAGTLFASPSAPGYQISGVANNTSAWHSLQSGTAVAGNAYIGIDFGINLSESGSSEYAPIKPNWKSVGAIQITQGNTAFNFARQLRVDITDGAVELGTPAFSGAGTATLTERIVGPNAENGYITIMALGPTTSTVRYFDKFSTNVGKVIGIATNGTLFQSTIVSFLLTGTSVAGDLFTFDLNYVWKRAGVFNVVQSSAPVIFNLQKQVQAKAVRVVPTFYTGTSNWEIISFIALDSSPTDINNIQDLFYNENRDRDYDKVAIPIKAQYTMSDSITDLSKFGLSMLDGYSFVVSFPVMVAALGRPIVTGDIVEVIPELQYDQNLKAIRKFVEVTDTGWASEGFSPSWKPTLYRFAANVVTPSQETRDIFGTINTQKYMVADSFFSDLGVGQQIDTTPLTQTEEIAKESKRAVPEIGSDDTMSTKGTPLPKVRPPVNAKGQPPGAQPGSGKQGVNIEDGLPPDGMIYGEGYALPDSSTSTDGNWFRLYYPESTNIPARLYRFSLVKNKWIYMETDRRSINSSMKPSLQRILQSPTKVGLSKKQI